MNYFELKNVACSYSRQAENIVLEIEHLEIPKGCMIFIVGESGCGKSTALETLGLMNNTLVAKSDSKFVFHPDPDTAIDCLSIWNESDKKMSEIRQKHFSFIFQQTNLMRNFSIRQNALLPLLIKESNNTQRIKEYQKVLDQVGLSQIIKENKHRVDELSGGQQQRLAFVRAFMPDFSILFGDEPTGNLDPINADNLMSMIKAEIRKSENKTAIIVSHTPDLYNRYADLIIRIHRKEHPNGKFYGVIDKSSVESPKNA